MALYQRKFLQDSIENLPGKKKPDDDKKNESSSDCIYDCPYQLPPPKNHIPPSLILLFCILGAAFLFLSCFAIYRYRSRRRRSSPRLENDIFREDFIDQLQGPVIDHPIWYIRTVGLPQSVIDSIEVFKYKKGEGLIEGIDCSVCLSEFEEDESLRLLPKCSHAFHVPCIDTWLRSHTNCPVCRAPVATSDVDQVGSGDTSSISSGSTEENQVESGVGAEEARETRSGAEIISALPIEDAKQAEVSSGGNGGFRVVSDLADRRAKVDQELEPVRRSVSMDFSSASTIYKAVADIHAEKDEGSWSSLVSRGRVPGKKSLSVSSLMEA